MGRLLLVVFILGLIIYSILRFCKKILSLFIPSSKTNPAQVTSENLVACQYCQLFTPQSQAVKLNGCYYCCQEHANQSSR